MRSSQGEEGGTLFVCSRLQLCQCEILFVAFVSATSDSLSTVQEQGEKRGSSRGGSCRPACFHSTSPKHQLGV